MMDDDYVCDEHWLEGEHTGHLGSVRCSGQMKTSVPGLLHVLPREGDDGGRGNDDDERSHRESFQARIRAKEEGGDWGKKGEWTRAARVLVGRG